MSVTGLIRRSRRPYLLVNQELIVSFLVLVWEVFLDLPQITSLLKELSVNAQLFSFRDFSLANKGKKLPGIIELLSQLLKFLYALGVPPASLPNLADLPPPETDIGITIVSIRSRTELKPR